MELDEKGSSVKCCATNFPIANDKEDPRCRFLIASFERLRPAASASAAVAEVVHMNHAGRAHVGAAGCGAGPQPVVVAGQDALVAGRRIHPGGGPRLPARELAPARCRAPA
jgi:hypothetical protein